MVLEVVGREVARESVLDLDPQGERVTSTKSSECSRMGDSKTNTHARVLLTSMRMTSPFFHVTIDLVSLMISMAVSRYSVGIGLPSPY